MWNTSVVTFFVTSLQRKLMLTLTILVILVMSIVGTYWLNTQQQRASAELEARAMQIAGLLGKTLASPWWDIELRAVRDQIDAVMTDPEVFSVAIYELGANTPFIIQEREGQVVDGIVREATVTYVREQPALVADLGIVRVVYTRQYVYQEITRTRLLIGGIILSLIVILAGGTYVLLNRMVQRPVKDLVTLTSRIAGGDFEARIRVAARDEIGQLADSCNRMAEQLHSSHTELENRVTERTRDLARRNLQIQAAAEVGSAVISIRDLDELLLRVTHMISARFEYYHVGIFLLDANKEYAVLRAANSQGGQRMLKREHKLRVGEQGIVGYVTSTGEPRIALDVGDDAIYFKNPLLPDTHSEMALPLLVGEELLGALDVQSVERAAFAAEDIRVLKILTDQVAVAIENARLFTQVQTAIDIERRAYGEVRREAWDELLRGRGDWGYQYNRVAVVPTGDVCPPEMRQAAGANEIIQGDSGGQPMIVAPLKLQDQVIGALRLRKSTTGRAWTEEELRLLENLLEQLSVALESARLYEDTQRRAARERLVGDVTARMRETLDIDAVLRTVVREIGETLNIPEVEVRIGGGMETAPLSTEAAGVDYVGDSGESVL